MTLDGKYFDVKIKAGYKGSGDVTMFDGGILYISNNRTNTKTTQAIILCASKLVAKFSQSRINLTLNSGLNLYSAAKYVLSKAGVGHIIMDMDDYNKNEFNDSLDQLKPKHVKFFKGLAISLLDIVRRFNLIIDSRIYNMLRYLELNR